MCSELYGDIKKSFLNDNKTGQGVATFLCGLKHKDYCLNIINDFLRRIIMKENYTYYNEIVFTDQQLEDIKASYLNGESSVSIGKRYGCTHKPILKALRKANVEIIPGRTCRKYAINERFFDTIDTQDKAYILGFLYADGHNGISKSTVTMSLQEEDRYILERIRETIGSEKPLEFLDYSNKNDYGYHYKNQYRLNMFSVHMCKALFALGMTSNKSLTLEFPNIPPELHRHFIRGYFDGDGTINKKTGSFILTSTKQFLSSIQDILHDALGVDKGILQESPCHNGITYDLKYHRKSESSLILDWLYKDANLYLKRKYNLYEQIHLKNSLVA